MNIIKTILLIGLAMISLTGCTKTVQWEEEVLLNTGETIVVKRNGSYKYKGLTSDSNAFSYVPEWQSTIEFTYKEKKYSHTDDAPLQLLAIAPDGTPNLIAATGAEWGRKNKYHCVTPSYVQFRPDNTGKAWTWPDKIDVWLYGLRTNLLLGLAPLADDGKKFSSEEQQQENASITERSKQFKNIDPTYTTNNCPTRK